MRFLKEISKRFFSSQLITGSFIMALGSFVAGGIGGYLYHLLMGRMLGPVDYGVLASLISLSYLLNIPLSALNLIIIKFVSTFKGRKEMGKVGLLFKKIHKKALPFSFLTLLIFLVLTPIITSFLHLSSPFLFIIMLIFFFVSIFSMINRSFLQGLLRFGWLATSSIVEMVIKLIVAVILVILGFKVGGALLGILIGGVIGLFFTFPPLRFLLKEDKEKLKINTREIFNFVPPVFFSTLAFTSLFTSDVVLVRHFLPAQEAGLYAALSILGKIIFFVTGPITSVMFPLISERHANGKHYKNLLVASLGVVGFISLAITGIYFLLPKLTVRILFGVAYLPIASSLGLFGIFLTFYSLAFLLANFYLSIQKTKPVILCVIAAIFQIIFIWFFHQNLNQIIWISFFITTLLLVGLLIFLLKYNKLKA